MAGQRSTFLAPKKSGQERKPGRLAFFGVKLRREYVLPRHRRRDRKRSVPRARDDDGWVARHRVIGVREIKVGSVSTGRFEKWMPFAHQLDVVPTHVRNFDGRAAHRIALVVG